MNLLTALGLFLFSTDTIELIEISAAWCIPCQQQTPIIRRVESEGIRVHHVEFDKERNIADAWRVESVPTTIILQSGREVRRFVGFTSYETFQATLKQFSPAP